jgi:hypothetical protein
MLGFGLRYLVSPGQAGLRRPPFNSITWSLDRSITKFNHRAHRGHRGLRRRQVSGKREEAERQADGLRRPPLVSITRSLDHWITGSFMISQGGREDRSKTTRDFILKKERIHRGDIIGGPQLTFLEEARIAVIR